MKKKHIRKIIDNLRQSKTDEEIESALIDIDSIDKKMTFLNVAMGSPENHYFPNKESKESLWEFEKSVFLMGKWKVIYYYLKIEGKKLGYDYNKILNA